MLLRSAGKLTPNVDTRTFFSRYWFLCLLALIVPIGLVAPGMGREVRESAWVIPTLVGVTLGISGFTLDTRRLAVQAANWRAILLTLSSTYLVAPAAGWGACWLFGPDEGAPVFLEALMIMAAQAGTLASALALTLVARGDQELALILTLLSNSLTVILTPLVLNLATGANVSFPAGQMMARMALVVLLPMTLGQVARRFLWSHAQPVLPVLRIVPQLIILVFVYTGFAAAAGHLRENLVIAARFLVACVCLHAFLIGFNYLLAGWIGLDSRSRTAVVYCGSQKTLPNGIYLWDRFFAHNPYGAIPLVLYHMFQLVVDTLLLPVFERQNKKTLERGA